TSTQTVQEFTVDLVAGAVDLQGDLTSGLVDGFGQVDHGLTARTDAVHYVVTLAQLGRDRVLELACRADDHARDQPGEPVEEGTEKRTPPGRRALRGAVDRG